MPVIKKMTSSPTPEPTPFPSISMPASTSEPADRLTGALPRQEEKIPAPPAPRPRPPLPARVGLRRPGATFLGVRIGESQDVTLPDDVTVVARPGDWIVQVGHVPISVV